MGEDQGCEGWEKVICRKIIKPPLYWGGFIIGTNRAMRLRFIFVLASVHLDLKPRNCPSVYFSMAPRVLLVVMEKSVFVFTLKYGPIFNISYIVFCKVFASL